MKSFFAFRRLRRWVGAARVPLVLVLLGAASRGADVSVRMDEIVQQHVAAEEFSGAVLVAQRGVALFDRAYGFANVEWDIPNLPTTHFRIGSITKQFTAVTLLLLEERGRLKLTDAVSVHLPDAPEAWSKITLHHLLTHTSGIPNVTNDPEFFLWKLQPATVRQMVDRFRDLPLDFPTGDRHVYSNSNYLVLGLVVETVTGQRFGDFLIETVLTPLGLNNTGFDSNQRILPRRASGYIRRGHQLLNAPYSDMSVPHAAGAMYSTTHDLWRWAEAIFGDKLLTPASRAKLLTPTQNNYALGVRVAVYQGRKLVEHGGNISGFSSFLRHYPEQGVTIVVLSNQSTRIVEGLTGKLAAVFFAGTGDGIPARTPIAVTPATLEAYCGVYEVGPGKQVTFRLVDGNFTAQPSGQDVMRVFAESETKFYFNTVDIEVEFVRDERGQVTHLMMKREGRTRKAPRIAD